jgi:subtilisin family serine protease
MLNIGLKDLLTELHHKDGFWRTHFCCPRCGYHDTAETFGLGPVPSPLLGSRHVWKDDIIALEKLRIFTIADLLNARPWEILSSSKISHENLAIYIEQARYWLAAEGERARHFLHKQGWPDRALQAISGAMAMRLLALRGEPGDDRVEVSIQMADVLPLEEVIGMEAIARLTLRQNHARETQASLIDTLNLGDDHTQIWLSNQFIAFLDFDQIGRVAASPAVRSVCPTLPFEGCIDEGIKRVSATTLLSARTGEGQTIALLDSGVDSSHPDLTSAQIIHKEDYTGNGTVDQHGHGTHLAGIIASGHGKFKGVAPKTTIWSYRVLNEDGTGASQKELVRALQDAVQDAVTEANRLAQKIIINCSCAVPRSARGWGRDYESVCDAFDAATTDAIVIVAAGNQGPLARTITAPGGGAAVLTVGASVDRPDSPHNFVAHYSSRGPAIHRRSKPDIIAPGGLKNLEGNAHDGVSMVSSKINGVWAHDSSDQKPWDVDQDHYGASGTSQATAVVSALCALLLEELTMQKRQVNHQELAQALKDKAHNLGFPRSEQGLGLIQADETVQWF